MKLRTFFKGAVWAGFFIIMLTMSGHRNYLSAGTQEYDHACKQVASLFPRVLDEKLKATTLFSDLLELTHVSHDGTLDNIVVATQKAWLRPAGKERYETQKRKFDDAERMIKLLEILGYVHSTVPLRQYYDRALVFGSLLGGILYRLDYLCQLWKQGIRFKKVIFLGGKRTLVSEKENSDLLFADPSRLFKNNAATQRLQHDFPTSEDELMVLLADAMVFPWEEESVTVEVVRAPALLGARRATTFDTVQAWLAHEPELDLTCIAVSNQPHVAYQQAVLFSAVPSTIICETVGNEMKFAIDDLSIILDSIARQLYQIQFYVNQQSKT